MSTTETTGNPVDTMDVRSKLDQVLPAIQSNLGPYSIHRGEIEPELRLADLHCGPVSVAVADYLHQQGIESVAPMVADNRSLRQEFPNAAKDHVIDVVEAEDPIIIDPTYRQHFRAFGLDMWFAHEIGNDLFPAEQILVFKQSETEEVVARMRDFTLDFIAKYKTDPRFVQAWKNRLDKLRLDANSEEIARYFQQIWDIARYQPFEIDDRVQKLASAILPAS